MRATRRDRASISLLFPKPGQLRRMQPISTAGGTDRGVPIYEFYCSTFLGKNRMDLSSTLTVTEGGPIGAIGGHEHLAAYVAGGENLEGDRSENPLYGCIFLKDVLSSVQHPEELLRATYRLLEPDGVLLATAPAMPTKNSSSLHTRPRWGFTAACLSRLAAEHLGPDARVDAYGNVLSATASLYGLAAEELSSKELDLRDPQFPVMLGLRAVKRSAIETPAYGSVIDRTSPTWIRGWIVGDSAPVARVGASASGGWEPARLGGQTDRVAQFIEAPEAPVSGFEYLYDPRGDESDEVRIRFSVTLMDGNSFELPSLNLQLR